MGICKILIKMKGKLKTKQIITNKHTRVSVFFSCVVFSDVIFLRNLKSRNHCASCFYKWFRCKMRDFVYTYYSNYRVHWFMIWHYPGSWASIQLNSKYAIHYYIIHCLQAVCNWHDSTARVYTFLPFLNLKIRKHLRKLIFYCLFLVYSYTYD